MTTFTAFPNACGGTNAIGGAEANRSVFDDVCDYNGLTDVGAEDQNGNPIGALVDYTVGVTVNDVDVLNGLNGTNGQVVRIDITVTHVTGETMNLSSVGVLFRSTTELEIGSPIEYFITLQKGMNGKDSVRLHCVGKVVRRHQDLLIPSQEDEAVAMAATLERYEFVRPEVSL